MDICRGWRLDTIWHVDYSLWTALSSQGKVFFFLNQMVSSVGRGWCQLTANDPLSKWPPWHLCGATLYQGVKQDCTRLLWSFLYQLISEFCCYQRSLLFQLKRTAAPAAAELIRKGEYLTLKSQLWSESWAADLSGKEDKQVPSEDRTFILVRASWGA